MLAEVFGNGLGEAMFEPEGVIFLAIAALLFATVIMVLGGALAVLQEAIFSGGPPSGLGLR